MEKTANAITAFFDVNFKKKFLLSISIPFLISLIYFIDISILPARTFDDEIVETNNISHSSSAGGTSMRQEKKVGKDFTTQKGYHFSTLKAAPLPGGIRIEITPIFKTVKSVHKGKRKLDVQSGLEGINGLLLIGFLISSTISICYTLLKKSISEDARLNLIYINILLICVWGYGFYKFVL
ncbi:hypothetical protein KH5_07460 [Urechidicola sp. KH5]